MADGLAAIARTGPQGEEHTETKLKYFEQRARAYGRLRAMVEEKKHDRDQSAVPVHPRDGDAA